MYIGAETMDNSMKVPQKIKNRTLPHKSNNPTSWVFIQTNYFLNSMNCLSIRYKQFLLCAPSHDESLPLWPLRTWTFLYSAFSCASTTWFSSDLTRLQTPWGHSLTTVRNLYCFLHTGSPTQYWMERMNSKGNTLSPRGLQLQWPFSPVMSDHTSH